MWYNNNYLDSTFEKYIFLSMLKYGKNKMYLVNVHLYQVTDHLQNRNVREYFIIVTAKCIKYPLSKIYVLYKLVSINSGNHSFSHFIIFDELVRWMNKNNLCKLIPLKTTIVTKPTNTSSENTDLLNSVNLSNWSITCYLFYDAKYPWKKRESLIDSTAIHHLIVNTKTRSIILHHYII